jgi:hypothetical protein
MSDHGDDPVKQDCWVGEYILASCIGLYSLILPGILSTGVKWYILKRLTGKGTQVLSSMLYNCHASVVMAVIGLAAGRDELTQALFPGVTTWSCRRSALSLVIVLIGVLLLNRHAFGHEIIRTAFQWSPGVRDKGRHADADRRFQAAGRFP